MGPPKPIIPIDVHTQAARPFKGRHVNINSYCLTPQHIISATFPRILFYNSHTSSFYLIMLWWAIYKFSPFHTSRIGAYGTLIRRFQHRSWLYGISSVIDPVNTDYHRYTSSYIIVEVKK